MLARVLLVGAALVATGCARRTIPGTDIQDNEDTQQILALMKKYVAAFEARDAEGVMALVSPDFSDNGGTSTPEDDLDFRNLGEELKRRFERVDRVRLEIDVRDIAVKDDQATAIYYWALRYEMPNVAEKIQTASELKQMLFKRADGTWRIASGI